MKAKIEKDKNAINHEIQDVRAATDEIIRSKDWNYRSIGTETNLFRIRT